MGVNNSKKKLTASSGAENAAVDSPQASSKRLFPSLAGKFKKGHSYHVAEEEDNIPANASPENFMPPVPEPGKRSSSLFVSKNSMRKDNSTSQKAGGAELPRYQSFDAILTIPFFEDLTPARAKQLHTLFERKVFGEDEVIVREGLDMEHSFFVIIQGTVKLTARRKSLILDEKEERPAVHLADLTKGSCFGTTALISSDLKPVPITAISQTKSTIIMSISREKFAEFAKENDLFPCLKAKNVTPFFSEKDDPEPLSVLFRLQSLPFFRAMDDYMLRQLGVLFEFRRYQAGDKIMSQGDQLDGFYVLVKGSVEITILLPYSNQLKHFGTIRPQDCFGELSLIEHTLSLATYTARTETVVVILRTEKFERFLSIAPDVINHEHFKNLVRKRTSEALKRIPIFNSTYQTKQKGPVEKYDESSLDILAGLFQFVEYPEGADFYRQGKPADAFYIIVQGEVQVWSEATIDGNQDIEVEELKDGEWFGDAVLYSEEKESLRTESVTALTKTVVLRLSSSLFDQFRELAPQVCGQIRQRLSMKTAEKLQRIPFFKGIKENKPWSKIGLLGALFKFELFEAGAVLCKEGDIGDKFYVIVEGKFSVTVHNENSGDSIELETLSNDQWFGEMALLLHTPRCATVTATANSLVLSLTTTAFKRFLDIAPELSASFQNLVTSRTANTLKRFSFFKSVKENRAWSKLELLASLMNYEVMEAYQEVFHLGSKGDKFYIIAQGAVDVFVDSPAGSGLPPTKIDHLEEGSYFGEIALLEETARTATVVTVKQTVLLAITHESFKRFLSIAPELKPIIDKTATRRHRTLSSGMTDEMVRKLKEEQDTDGKAQSS